MKTMHLMRSLMFVPGHNEALLRKAAVSDADVLLLDVEDSVQPIQNKEVARNLILSLLAEGIFDGKPIYVRINDRESGEMLKDLLSLSVHQIEGFVYPKAKGAEDIVFMDLLLETIEFKDGLELGKFNLIPLIETAEAVLNVLNIAKSSKRIVGLAYGCEDFLADLEGLHDDTESALFVPRAMIAMAARSTGVTPIDTVHVKVHDLEDLERNLKIAKTMGFEGMLILNPKEIPLVHQYFSPTENEICRAREMVTLANSALSKDQGVAMAGERFIGPPLLAAAQKILKKSKLIDKFANQG